MRTALVLAAAGGLMGCSDSPSAKPNGAVGIEPLAGRYHFISAQQGFPPMILDTATGCLDSLYVSKPQDEDGVVTKLQVDYGSLGDDAACKVVDASLVRTGK